MLCLKWFGLVYFFMKICYWGENEVLLNMTFVYVSFAQKKNTTLVNIQDSSSNIVFHIGNDYHSIHVDGAAGVPLPPFKPLHHFYFPLFLRSQCPFFLIDHAGSVAPGSTCTCRTALPVSRMQHTELQAWLTYRHFGSSPPPGVMGGGRGRAALK